MFYALSVPGPIEDVEEVRVLEWHGEPGRSFAVDELIVELETHKALVEVRAGQPGVLRRVLCQAGEWQAVGCVLAILSDDPKESIPDHVEGLQMLLVNFEVA